MKSNVPFYINLSYSGYGETKILEENISKERVLELKPIEVNN